MITSLKDTGNYYYYFRNKAQVCYCGESICSGYIGGSKSSTLKVDDNKWDEDDNQSEEEIESNVEGDENIKKRNIGLQTVDQVQSLIKSLMYTVTDAKKVLVKLNKLIVFQKFYLRKRKIIQCFVNLFRIMD